MKREQFLKEYHDLKEKGIFREGDNRYAYYEGNLASIFNHDVGEFKYSRGVLTHPVVGDNEDIKDLDVEPWKTGYRPCSLVVVYWRKNRITTVIDFYESAIYPEIDMLLASWQTTYYLTDAKGTITHEIYPEEVKTT